MTNRKTIVGTNTSLSGDAVSTTIDNQSNPNNHIVNNLNVKVTTRDVKEEKEQKEQKVVDGITVVQPSNPYEEIVKYPSVSQTDEDKEILQFLLKVFQEVIINDPASAVNIIDQSGLVVLSTTNLITLIAKVCAVEMSSVKIEFEEDGDTGCCGFCSKANPLKRILAIKVKKDTAPFNDFQSTYNTLYNKIIEDYKVSLESVYIPIF